MTEVATSSTQQFVFLKWIIGVFRLMHFLPVITVTTIGAAIAYISLGGISPITIAPFVLIVLTIFFQEASCGFQNDYVDREIDTLYQKRKAITDGWISPKAAFCLGIICSVLFSAFSIGVGFYSTRFGLWSVLFVQGANLIGVFYNLYAKHKSISILPYIIGFPLIPTYVWLTFGGFELKYLWMIPLMTFVSFPAHVANELPDYHLDKKYGMKNFTVAVGKKASTILYWLGVLLIEIELIIVFVLYSLNLWVFLATLILSIIFGIVAIVILWKRNWETDLLVFNLVTVCIGIEVLGFFLLMSI